MKIKDIFNIESGTDMELNISNYLDFFYHASQNERQDSIKEEPEHKEDISQDNYAYTAAMVEKLCTDYHLEYPDWIFAEKYYLKTPWFPPQIKGKARIYLMLYSPLEFLTRNIYVSENILTRA